MKKILFLSIFIFYPFLLFSSGLVPPSRYFDLSNWMLQIPGPAEIKNLNEYASLYFFTAPDHSICFNLDAQDKGHTKNSEYVRSELRHLLNWSIEENHEISATVKVACDLEKYQVTVVQIHGITGSNENAPPLLRIAAVNGNLYAFLKTYPDGKHTEKKLLKTKISDYFSIDIKNEKGRLTIYTDGQTCLYKDLNFWKYKNYFKLGCYPQEHKGRFNVYVKYFAVH